MVDIADGIVPPRSTSGALAGATLADEYDLKTGSRVRVGNETVRITGILEEQGMGFDINPDNALIVSDRWYSTVYDQDDYDQVIVKVRDINDIDAVKLAIERALNRRDDEVTVYDTRMILEMIVETFNQISLFTTAIGGISLLVAGVSIFNVQMMSVTERIKEIGIIRSIGTKRSEVMRMFLYEAFILGLLGSCIGGGVLSFAGGYIAVSVMLQDASYLFYPETLFYIPPYGWVSGFLSLSYPACIRHGRRQISTRLRRSGLSKTEYFSYFFGRSGDFSGKTGCSVCSAGWALTSSSHHAYDPVNEMMERWVPACIKRPRGTFSPVAPPPGNTVERLWNTGMMVTPGLRVGGAVNSDFCFHPLLTIFHTAGG